MAELAKQSSTLPDDTAQQRSSGFLAIVVFVAFVFYTLAVAIWPDISRLPANSGLPHPPPSAGLMVHLADDVMVSLRAGQMLMETGRPSFNRTDAAQPSTSYLAPYLYAALSGLLATNAALIAYAILGLLAAAATLALIAYRATFPALALAAALALALTRTNMIYTLNGWDHLFQAFFLTTATLMVLRWHVTSGDLLKISLAIVLGTLFRPDGLLVSMGILAAAYCAADRKKTFFIYCLMPALAMAAAFLLANWLQFTFLTPTTARLKMGAAPSLDYMMKYGLRNSISSFTAASVAIAGLAVYALFHRKLYGIRHLLIVAASVLTGAAAAYNSDVFIGARMFWTPACVMVAVICMAGPAGLADLAGSFRRMTPTLHAMSDGIRERAVRLTDPSPRISASRLLMPITLCAMVAFASPRIYERYQDSIIRIDGGNLPVTVKQLLIAEWIANRLAPADGAIGLFYLGIGFHLPAFEVADFLGKADELIAGTPVKWGPPGHNKWDIDATLEKWAPQAIIAGSRGFPKTENEIKAAAAMLAERRDYAFLQDFLLNERLGREYVRCYILTLPYGIEDDWGIIVRRSLVERLTGHLTCVEPHSNGMNAQGSQAATGRNDTQ
jgi:hypothetical protein